MFKPRQKNYNNDSSFAVNGLLSHRSAMTLSKEKEKTKENKKNRHLEITQKTVQCITQLLGFLLCSHPTLKKNKKEKLWQNKNQRAISSEPDELKTLFTSGGKR